MSTSWAEAELAHARLGDQRRVDRAIQLLDAWAEQPEQSIPLASGTKAAVKGAYRFLENEAIAPAALREAHAAATAARIGAVPEVWVAQDTTSLDFTAKAATQGLGPLDSIYTRGLKVHSALAFTPEGVPLGLVHQRVWARDPEDGGTRHRRRQRTTAEKESQRWIETVEVVEACLPEAVRVWVIGDAESDIYALFAHPRRAGIDLLGRAAQDRCVRGGEAERLWAAVEAAPVQAEREVDLGRTPQRTPRRARVSLRFCALELLPPRHAPQRRQLPAVPIWAVLVRRGNRPRGRTRSRGSCSRRGPWRARPRRARPRRGVAWRRTGGAGWWNAFTTSGRAAAESRRCSSRRPSAWSGRWHSTRSWPGACCG